MKFQKYLAELVGAFMLTLGVYLSLALGMPIATPFVAALILGTGVYTVGSISGAHFNPAVSIAMASVKKLKWEVAIFYVVFQIIGALLAMLFADWMLSGGGIDITSANDMKIGVAEFLGAGILAFGVSAVTFKKVHEAASGITVGWSLLIGILIASGFSNGIVNPAVAIGLGSVSYTYLLAPVAGAVAAAWFYRYLVGSK